MRLKALAKRVTGRVLSTDLLEKLTEYSIAERSFRPALTTATRIVTGGDTWDTIVLRGREELWRRTLQHTGSDDILLLEFGVFEGDSMRSFVQLNRSQGSRFYGFDSFEGLPEDWRGLSAHHFDVAGSIPEIDDGRVTFVKGWFRDTLPGKMGELVELSKSRAVVVHIDADLYSSTLYVLFTLATKIRNCHIIFDEFSGHESRALYNYCQAAGADCQILYRLDWKDCPQVVSGVLSTPTSRRCL